MSRNSLLSKLAEARSGVLLFSITPPRRNTFCERLGMPYGFNIENEAHSVDDLIPECPGPSRMRRNLRIRHHRTLMSSSDRRHSPPD
ncbi:MAG TPA: hypothetical protein VFG35_09355 [Actinoplanes sp.]|nr:hypothetical protein [Actinoplanes sp.]